MSISEDDSLQGVIFQLMKKQETMFYGFFISELNKAFSTRIPTACMAKHPNSRIPQILFNPDFWAKLTPQQKKYLVVHEVEHYIHEHWNFTQEFALDVELTNIAYDLYINTHLNAAYTPDMAMPPGGLDEKTFPALNMKPCQGSMYYYNILKQAKEKKRQSAADGKDSLAGPKGNGRGTSGDKVLDGMLDDRSAEGLHVTWSELTENMTDLEKEMLSRQIREMAKRSAEETEKSRGTIPAHLSEVISRTIEKIEPFVSWKSLLRQFVGSSLSVEVKTTRKKPNFRYPDAPSLKYKYKVRGLFLCDSSGLKNIKPSYKVIYTENPFNCWKTSLSF